MDITNRKEVPSIKTTESTGGTNSQALDLLTITKASQVLTSEIKLDKLLAKLMKIVIENGGAQRGFLLLEKDHQWFIEAEGKVDTKDITILRSLALDSVESDRSIPLLPVAIINYVARTQENVVLNNAVEEGQFTLDPYITATQPKSILCTPLLNQGKLSGIVYLENNLTTGAFTSERIEVLRILSSQAAISIENARLYEQLEDYSRNLEQKVSERTEELSQTLDILKATQAELIFENDLLRSAESTSSFDYQVGGSLPMDAPTYSEIPTNIEAEWIENLVQTNIIDNWESQDEPEHLKTIRDRILKNEHQPDQLLELYRQIWHQGTITAVDNLGSSELLLSGLVVKQQGTLRINNRIYQSIFNHSWIDSVHSLNL